MPSNADKYFVIKHDFVNKAVNFGKRADIFVNLTVNFGKKIDILAKKVGNFANH
ncbi:hypothetical protein PB1_17259 [Bacillus methanolicus PB1]|uniref:Uncharacterized protein n=1 Tax=Bacillus methanolicus PB1 TaxID=997296 RepID=I3DYK6_BACMT|nr:hypothetical protein PB1_17259 [Bacillus methanolicus PB1]